MSYMSLEAANGVPHQEAGYMALLQLKQDGNCGDKIALPRTNASIFGVSASTSALFTLAQSVIDAEVVTMDPISIPSTAASLSAFCGKAILGIRAVKDS
jgi:hypothetical protein